MAEPNLDLIQTMIQRVLDGQRDLRDDMADVKRRLSSLELAVTQVHGDFAGQSMRIDRIETRLDRMERRLDIGDA
ncbi:hypothetical protein [Magnetospirillum sp. UT-4]|uniref:hypothetical protein n=1 Tax=Magnetospirillum sp. UT-4 TaxID=2681467 RepID=UPI0013834EB1|nr:hypothetical protein [Magnetospirillum sp. UT-4]CAA7624563.1 conserved hypothetical protein [Magnetospirillum sp. UT-4]